MEETHPMLEESPIEVLDSSEKPDEIGAGRNPGELGPLKKFLEIEARLDYRQEADLQRILDYAHKQGVQSDGDLAQWLKSLSVKLGTPDVGQTRVRQLLNYLELDDRAQDIIKQRDALVK